MLPVADGAIRAADRRHVAQLYSGLPIDLRYWGTAFEEEQSADVPFNQALANIPIVQFRNLLRTEGLLDDNNLSEIAWNTAVNTEITQHRQVGRTLDDYRPHGLLTVLLLPHGGESLLIEPAAEGALERMIERIRAIFEADRTKLLTTDCLTNIANREGFVSAAAQGSHTTYALAWRTPDEDWDARGDNEDGRLIPFARFGWFTAATEGKADYVDPGKMQDNYVDKTDQEHPDGAAILLSEWNHVGHTYQTIVFSDNAAGTVRFTFNGQTTADIVFETTTKAADIAANDDLRRLVRAALADPNLTNIGGKVSVFAVSESPRTLRVMFFLDKSNSFDAEANPTGKGYFPETTFENSLTVDFISNGQVDFDRGIAFDFTGDFTDANGNPYVDDTGKSIAAIWSNNVLTYLEEFVDDWCNEYKQAPLNGRMDAVFFDHEIQNHYFTVLNGIYCGGKLTSPETDPDGHAAVFARLKVDQGRFAQWAALLPQEVANDFANGVDWLDDEFEQGRVYQEYVRMASLKMSAVYIERILNAIKTHFPDVVSSDYAMCGTNLATPTHLLRTGYVLGDGATVNQRHDYPLYISNAYYVHTQDDLDPLVVPDVSKDRSWIPNAWSIVKAVSRDSSGVVKVELYNENEIAASNNRRGNGQFLSGFYLGQRVSINTLNLDNYQDGVLAPILPNTEDREAKRFPVVEIHNDHDDPYLKYQDDRTTAVSQIVLSGISSSGGSQVFFHSLSEWQMFLQGIRIMRGALATNAFPLSMWYEWDKELNIAQFKETKLRPSLMLHAALMGEYNTPFRKYYAVSAGSVTYHKETSAGNAAWTATHDSADEQAFCDVLKKIDALFACKPDECRPLWGLHLDFPSMQRAEAVLSGMSLRSNRRILRLDARPESHVGVIYEGDDYVDFRLASGEVWRLPGQIMDDGGLFRDTGVTLLVTA